MEITPAADFAHSRDYLPPLRKPDKAVLLMSDDNVLHKQIEATHSPDGREFNTGTLLYIVQDILNRATPTIGGTLMSTKDDMEHVEERGHRNAGLSTMLEALSFTIDRISCEIAWKSMGGSDVHSTTINLLHLLSNYAWDAKLVLTMAAFALNYGEFWLLAQIYTSNSLAKSMAILKKLPTIMEHSGQLKPRFDSINNLIEQMIGITHCIVVFKELPSRYITHEHPDFVAFQSSLPMAVYWTIRAIIVCATQITSLSNLGFEYVFPIPHCIFDDPKTQTLRCLFMFLDLDFRYTTSESWDLPTLSHKISRILDNLKTQLEHLKQYIRDRMDSDAYETLKNLLEMSHIDNMKVLKALIYAKDDIQPLVDGATKRRVHIEVLRRRNVLLLISDLEISQDELSVLEGIYTESRTHGSRTDNHYEVVWIPIVDRHSPWSEAAHRKFESLQARMPWYTVHHPSLINKAVIKLCREDWHFKNNPILVVLDPQGKVACPNAIHMMWIWGSNAFPFTSSREAALWSEQSWSLQLLVDEFDPTITNWISEGKYIFVIGGDDIDWIRRFTKEAREVAMAEQIPLEMVYVGRSGKKELVKRAVNAIIAENLCYCWPEPASYWYFWARLDSMLFSKIQQGKVDEQDLMTQEMKKLLSFDKMGAWAVLSHGNTVLINGHRDTVLSTVTDYLKWRDQVPAEGFDPTITKYHRDLHGQDLPCCRFEFPSTAGRIPELLKCPECRRSMEKYVSFLCCHDEPALGAIY